MTSCADAYMEAVKDPAAINPAAQALRAAFAILCMRYPP
jgi:hypothetical protein